jgi:hypothetical protein
MAKVMYLAGRDASQPPGHIFGDVLVEHEVIVPGGVLNPVSMLIEWGC